MPKIPRLQPSRDSHISNFRIAASSPQSIGVAKASPERNIDTGERQTAAAASNFARTVGKAAADWAAKDAADAKIAAAALAETAKVYEAKHEEIRTSESQKLQMGVNEYFRNRKIDESKAVGSQSLGLMDGLKEETEKLRGNFVTEDMDEDTARELNLHFDKEYNRHAMWLANFSIKQSDVADSEARILSVQDAHSNIALLPPSSLDMVDKEVSKTLLFEKTRHPNLTDAQVELNRRSLKEDYLTFALTKWRQDNPTATSALWEANPDYFKKALPNTFNAMAKQMVVTKKNANYDTALGTLERLFGKDDAAAAKFVDEDTSNTLGLTQTQRLQVSSMLWSNNNHKVTEEKREEIKKEEDYLMSAHEKFFDPNTGVTNTPAALADLEQTFRQGGISLSLYTDRREKLMAPRELSGENYHLLMSDINDRKITTKHEILTAIAGTKAKPEPFFAELKKRQDQMDKGFTDNWFNVAYSKYTSLSSIDDAEDLPQGIDKKGLLVDITELPDFKRRLETVARLAGLSAGDPGIVDLANTLLTSGWYSPKKPEWHAGKANWLKDYGEEYRRLWEMPMSEIQEVLRSRGIETATSGNLKTSPKGGLEEHTPEEKAAIEHLTGLGIPVTKVSIKRAVSIMSKEKGGK